MQTVEFQVSKKEIVRRKRAFATLSVSLIVGFIISSLLLHFPIVSPFFISILSILGIANITTIKTLDSLMDIKMRITDKEIERIRPHATERIQIADITKVKTKWTTNHTIRELYMYTKNGSMFVNGLEDMSSFLDTLKSSVNKNCVFSETHEPIDYDHPLFYALLGLPISFTGVALMKYVLTLDYSQTRMVIIGFSLYLFLLGTYFLYAKPIAKRYGSQKQLVDYIFGLAMIAVGLLFILAKNIIR